MKAVLALLEVVPAWLWAALVVALLALCTHLHLGGVQAREAASAAERDLLAVQLSSARAIGAEKDRAAERVRNLNQALTETQDALFKAQQAVPARVAVLDGRLQQHARPVVCRSATPASAASGPAGVGDGNAGAGLRGLDGQDLVLVDGQARHELAEFAVSARSVGEALIEVRGLLRRCWRGQ